MTFSILLAAVFGHAAEKSISVSSGVLTCDYLEYRSSESVIVSRGNAVLISSGSKLEADELILNMESRTGSARGRVRMDDGAAVLLASEADFDWGVSTGVFTNGYFESPPHRLWARRVVRVSTDTYQMEHVAVTSCDLDPPHYHARMSSMEYVPGKRASTRSPRLVLGDTTIMGLPFYSKTFSEKPWTLTVDPGRSSYHGVYTKSVLSWPVTEHGVARAYWDHFHRTGEGFGGEYTYAAPNVRGSFFGYRAEDRVAGSDRWNARLGHWQRLRPGLILELSSLSQSDAGFNNLYFRDDQFRVRGEALSSAALTRRLSLFTARAVVRHDRVFDPERGGFVTSRTTFPELGFQGMPWRVARNTYFTTAFSVRHQYDRPLADPPALNPLAPERDVYRWFWDGSMNLKRTVALGPRLSLEPSVGAIGVWRSWRDEGLSRDPRDFLQGTGFTGLHLRHRLTKNLEQDFGHDYRVRWAPNTLSREHADPVDHGLESHLLSWSASYRRPRLWSRLSTGYDLRDSEGETFKSPREKIVAPVFDLYWSPNSWTSISHRQTYDLYPVRRPGIGQFSWRTGKMTGVQFSSGFSYNGGLPGEIQLRHGLSLPLTRGWHIESAVRYAATGPGGFRYDTVPKDRLEQEFIFRRDLHCWTARITYRKRPGFTEANIRVDLKRWASERRALRSPDEGQYYPGRDIEDK